MIVVTFYFSTLFFMFMLNGVTKGYYETIIPVSGDHPDELYAFNNETILAEESHIAEVGIDKFPSVVVNAILSADRSQ